MTAADGTPPLAFWQDLLPPGPPERPPYRDAYVARLPDGRGILLPLRPLPDAPDRAVASLIVNQAGFAVEQAVIDAMAERARTIAADIVVGLPTLGLGLARGVALALGHRRYVALGNSRKYWYLDTLSVPSRSITSPGDGKSLYIDPRLVPLVEGRRVLVIDDVVSTGGSLTAAIDLLDRLDATTAGIVVAMTQTRRWRRSPAVSRFADGLAGVLDTPAFRRVDGGWLPETETH
ncbi:MAG: phosphoribosyltransferase [Inquilinus sp.]|nr:phosphoribosyltransferase [Inquilinus sp.]